MKITEDKRKQFYALITESGACKNEIIRKFTNGRTTSVKEISMLEGKVIIQELRNIIHANQNKTDRMRKKVISIAHQMAWQTPEGKIDIKRLNEWCVYRTKYKKELNKHNVNELSGLISQIEIVHKKFLENIR